MVAKTGSKENARYNISFHNITFRPDMVWWIAIIFLCLIVYFPPSHIAVKIMDFLDSFVAYQHLRPSPFSSLFRMDAVADRAANGLGLNHLALSELNLVSIIYSIFPKYLDTALHLVFNTLFMFWTTFEILKAMARNISKHHVAISGAVAIYIAMLPINPFVISGIIGTNLIALALVRMKQDPNNLKNVVYFILAPLIAQAPFGPIFYYPIFFVIAVLWLRGKALKRFWALLLMSFVLSIVVDYRIYIPELFGVADVQTSRDLWLEGRSDKVFGGFFVWDNWQHAWKKTWEFMLSENNAHSAHYAWNPNNITIKLIGLCGLCALLAINLEPRRTWKSFRTGEALPIAGLRLFWGGVLMLILSCMATGIASSNIIDFWALLDSPIQVDRVGMIFVPIAAALALAGGLCLIINLTTRDPRILTGLTFAALVFSLWLKIDKAYIFALIIAVMALLACWRWNQSRHVFVGFVCAVFAGMGITATSYNLQKKYAIWQHFQKNGKDNPYIPHPTIGTYYEGGLFESLKTELGPDWRQENLVSVGVDPMVASVNGFRHLDGFYQQYPVSYKDKFHKILKPEFDIDTTNKDYFEGWGARVYVFASRYEDGKQLLDIDGCAVKSLGGTLLLSRYEIANPEDSELTFFKSISGTTQGLTGTIHTYQIDAEKCPG